MINNFNTSSPLGKQRGIIPQQQNIFISDNTSYMQTAPQLSDAIYFPQQSQLNINPLGQPQHQLNSHSIMATVGGMQQSTTNLGAGSSNSVYDSRLARVYTTGRNNASLTHPNATDLLDNKLNNVPNSSNAIFIDNFTSQVQKDHSFQSYRNAAQFSQQQQQQQTNFQQHYPHSLQLQHSTIPQRQQTQRIPENPQQQQTHFVHPNLIATSNSNQLMQLHLPTAHQQPIFLTGDGFVPESPNKVSTYQLPFKVNSSFSTATSGMYQQMPTATATTSAASAVGVMPLNSSTTTNSPVVLDRINICINNHYADSNFGSSVADAGSATVDPPSLPSPIIPPIQHNAIIDPSLLIEQIPTSNGSNSSISSNSTTSIQSIINEPDSTTTSHTPPSTPDNTNALANINAIQSPSTSSTARIDDTVKMNLFSEVTHIDETSLKPYVSEESNEDHFENKTIEEPIETEVQEPNLEAEKTFAIGDDVFVRIDDDRLYLGTVIDSKYQRYRVRFDDSSEMWCSPREMRKFGISDESISSNGREKCYDDMDAGTLCVACKKRDLIDIEICERCGRGYHQKCTTETSPGSGDWICKRCSKSMKVDPLENVCNNNSKRCITSTQQQQQQQQQQPQLPYDTQILHWDSKHRVNEEQIYCYCGKTGQFDYNMLQCWKCLNWFHTSCVQNFEGPMLRGDGYFVFCCAICSTDGKEFLRRLQMNCVDFIHLVLYNLPTQKKQQNHKYHHLIKDIQPYVISLKQTTAFPEEWLKLSENDLNDCVQSTLEKNTERFICGRELKRDYYFYGLRNNGPPPAPLCKQLTIHEDLNDKYITENLKLKLYKRTINDEYDELGNLIQIGNATDLTSDTDGKFTSDDELPIKQIIEKEKVKNNKTNTSDTIKNQNFIKEEIKSHKRKAFTLSRPYKETSGKRYINTANNCESSSDENSSSSRGTSLDLIIPPLKDFLGTNNPFSNDLINKKTEGSGSEGGKKPALSQFGRSLSGGPTIKNSVVNASALDFCSNLAALKNAGIFPNLNTTNFAKAAGQPRMVRTIKRRLSAKDIMIGPNQEVRRRRTRRLSSNVEVISTTTINPISSFFAINNTTGSTKTIATTTTSSTSNNLRKQNFPNTLSLNGPTNLDKEVTNKTAVAQQHGRRLRLRTQKSLPPSNSRRSSLSGASTSSLTSSSSSSSTSTSGNATPQTAKYPESAIMSKLQQTVNKYFGVSDFISTGEKFSVHAKRQMPNGQIQLLIEWGENDENSVNADSATNGTDEIEEKINKEESS